MPRQSKGDIKSPPFPHNAGEGAGFYFYAFGSITPF